MCSVCCSAAVSGCCPMLAQAILSKAARTPSSLTSAAAAVVCRTAQRCRALWSVRSHMRTTGGFTLPTPPMPAAA
eukprot:1633421-Prymnesium_polylepis.1